ncbi:MAG TPA: YncE family protein [Candidatus Udaeobacter sp.]|nr:YncE family protein [Candidatus Udaeobacter sp.]
MRTLLWLAIAAILLLAGSEVLKAQSFLKTVADVSLPGGTTRFDYQSLDSKTGRLYLSHMGDGNVVVFDTKTNNVVANIPGFPTVTGVLVVPALKSVYASVTHNHEVAVLDTENLVVSKRIKDGKFPDGLAYSPETHKVFVSDEAGGVETVIDTQRNERVNTIEMGGEVGNTQYDPVSHLIYACVQNRNELVEINPKTDKIQARYHLSGGKHPHGFYIDDQNGKAYIACEGDNKLLVFDMKNHSVENVFPVADGPDVLAFDRGLQLLYVACESGTVSLFRDSSGKVEKVENVNVGPNSHSVSVDSETHRAYFPLKNVNGSPILRIMMPANIGTNN